MKIGLFGGSFDPPHVAHLVLAERCREQATLDEVWFVPSYRPPHKLEKPLTKFETRCDMVELAIAGSPHFRVERIEKELPPPSYTVGTLASLRERHPTHTFELIIGGDSLRDFPTWHEPDRIVADTGLIVVARPGVALMSAPELAQALNVKAETVRISVVTSPQMDISSTDLRERAKTGRSIRYVVPRAVEEYVREKRVYS